MCDELKYTLALSLFQKLCRDEKSNFVISPLSLGTALAMLTAGLKGRTQAELLQLFGAKHEDELHAMYTGLLSQKELPLKIVNKYLADKMFSVQEKFDSLLRVRLKSSSNGVCRRTRDD